MPVNGAGIALLLAGGALAYSGVKGANLSDTVRGLISGDAIDTSPTSTAALVTGSVSGNGAKVVALAQSQLGKPYVFDTPLDWTLPNPPTFDCSGLTQWAYWQAMGVLLTHYTGTQYPALDHAPVANAQPGDLLFYSQNGSGTSSYHVAINIGGGQLIEAPEPGVPVHVRGWAPGDTELVQTCGVCPGASPDRLRNAL